MMEKTEGKKRKSDKGTFNNSESMPLILGAGTGGKKIIINLQ